MKKIITFVLGFSFFFPFVASAAAFVVSPTGGSYAVGNTITLNISVNPVGATIYTAMLDARFSPDTFEVMSFTLNDALFPLKQPSYDALDNTSGVLIKTGGFTGITSTAPFGTVVLRAKSSGAGIFTIADSSKLLDGNNTDQQSGAQTMTYSIATAPAPAQKPQSIIKTETPEKIPAMATLTETEAAPAQLTASAISNLAMNTSWVLVLIIVLALFGIGYCIRVKRSKR